MHAASTARKNNNQHVALRNQLLSTDIGNIDVRDEAPINNHQIDPYQQQQHFQPQPQQAYMSNSYAMPSDLELPNQRFNSGGPPHLQQQQQQYNYHPSMPPAMPFAAGGASPSGQPRSRRSSIQSNNSTFNMSSMNNFFKGNKSKSKFSGGGDDDDEEKDVMIDDTGNTMSFDDLSTLKDRGRYGGQSSFDSTPIIPTLQTNASRPFGSSSVSNVQYRKQMTAFKKQVMVNAGKMKDPRAMSLQGNGNPYVADPRAMSLQGNGNPYVADPRAMSLQGRNPYQAMNVDPRTKSMTGQLHPHMSNNPQSRTGSLTNQQFQPSPRAYSLTTSNPYQHQHQQQHHPMSRPPMNSRLHAPNQQYAHTGANHSPKFGLQPSSIPNRNSASNISTPNGSRPSSVNLSSPQQFPQNRQIPTNGDSNGVHQLPKPANTSNSFGGYNPSTPTIEEAPSLNDTESQYSEPPSATTTVASRQLTAAPQQQQADTSHHYLADNTLNNDEKLDDSGITYSDFSASQEKSSFIPPNDESTPSPSNQRNEQLINGHQNLGPKEFDDDETPSKLPRSKALPHLSLLKIRDEDSEDTVDEVHEKQLQSHRILEPVAESKDSQYFRNGNTTTPPPATSYDNSRRTSPTKSTFGTPGRKYISPSKNSPSPLKRQANMENGNTHKRFPMSISSMSEYSTFSGASDGYDNTDQEMRNKLYQLAGKSGTANDVFVTASQFSLIDNKNLDRGHQRKGSQFSYENQNEHPNTIMEHEGSYASENTPKLNDYDQSTPVIEHQEQQQHFRKSYDPSVSSVNESSNLNRSSTTDSASIKSSRSNTGSIKSSFKSPKFLQKWTKKRNDKKKNNSFEPVTKPVEIKSHTPPTQSENPVTTGPDLPFMNNKNNKLEATPSKGLHIMTGNDGNQGFKEAEPIEKEDSITFKSQRLSPQNHSKRNSDDKTITSLGTSQPLPDLNLKSDNNNLASQPTSASGTYSSHSTNNTIDTELENDSEGFHKGAAEFDRKRNSSNKSLQLQRSFEPEPLLTKSQPAITKKLNLTVDQLGIMEDKSSIVRELEYVSKELGDSIRREIKLEEQLKNKSIISSQDWNHENELREKILMISALEKQLNEERRKRYIAEEHVLLWENGSEPSALQLSYENEKLQSELLNKDELINKHQAEIDSLMTFDSPKNEDKIEALSKTNRELETVTIPSLKNEIEVLNNDKRRLSNMTEKFKLLKIENSELERKLQKADETKSIHSKQLEDELVQIKQKYEKRINKRNSDDVKFPATSPVDNRLKKTLLSDLGSANNSFDSLKPPSPRNGKRITSFSLINVTSPNEK